MRMQGGEYAGTGKHGMARTGTIGALAMGLILLAAPLAAANPATDHGNTPGTSTVLHFGVRAQANLDANDDADVFRVELQGRAVVEFRSGGSTDTKAVLSDSEGVTLASDDDGGTDSNFRILHTLEGGVYYLWVNGSDGATGNYQVLARIQRDGDDHGNTIGASTRVTGSEVAGSIRPADDVDAFRFDVPVETGVLLSTRGPTDTLGELRDSSGKVLQSADSGRDRGNFLISAQLTPGIYYLMVSARDAGGYTVNVQFDAAVACDIPPIRVPDVHRSVPVNDGGGDDLDSDGDGIVDSLDAFPDDARETTDTDRDGVGNNGDQDDDNDGAEDVIDELPLVAGRSVRPNVFRPSYDFAAYCADPRTGVDSSGVPFPDVQGSVAYENNWLRSWSNEEYLWYDEIVDVDPILHDTPTYFDLMRTFATTPSGQDKDRFHFTWETEDYRRARDSGVSVGYGAEWALLRASPPRDIRIAFTEPNSPVTGAGLTRGAHIIEIDGASVRHGDAAILNAGLFPDEPGETHEFVVRELGAAVGTERTVRLVAQEVAADPVQNDTILQQSGRNIGYMAFHDHNRVAEEELAAAVRRFRNQSVTDLVLDLRYNGGGLLYIAAELGYMIAGPRSNGKVFDGLQYNDKRSDRNQAFPFINTDIQNRPLPSLDLERVYILSSGRTCSASESIINGLRGIDVEVILIGGATCGKPYGFLPADNCGTTYFSIQFKSVNEKGFGDFADGFVPVVGGGTEPWEVPGCFVADDFDHLLGDPDEARLAAALGYMQTGTCPAASVDSLASLATDGDIRQLRSARTILRQNRWYDGYREAVVRQERRRAVEAD